VSAAEKRERLEAVVREQLREAWERGLAAAPNGPGALADAGAPGAFQLTVDAAFAYADAVFEGRIERMGPEQWRARLRLAEATAEADGRQG
jgi:hypothetical protein